MTHDVTRFCAEIRTELPLLLSPGFYFAIVRLAIYERESFIRRQGSSEIHVHYVVELRLS